MGTHAEPQAPLDYRGLEQFARVGSMDGVSFCVSGDRAYALDLDTVNDVICLLLGPIHSTCSFEDDHEEEFVFFGESTAFHPREGHIRVNATDVRRGFIAFSYTPQFEELADHGRTVGTSLGHSTRNMQTERIRNLARYAHSRLRETDTLDALEMQCLGSLVYMETTRRLSDGQAQPPAQMSNTDFERLVAFIQAELENPITCPQLAEVVNLPLRAVFDGMKTRTGMTPYRFVIEKRLERAQTLLKTTDLPIVEIAFACGFSSQQHMTTTLSRIAGVTPMRLRQQLS